MTHEFFMNLFFRIRVYSCVFVFFLNMNNQKYTRARLCRFYKA